MGTTVNIGFIPLLDCAPLVVADKLGLFDRHQLDVQLHREHSWASLIEKVNLGVYQAAHMLTPVLVAQALRQQAPKMISAINLGLNGNAITLANALLTPEHSLADAVLARKQGGNKLTFGVVYPFSMHNFQLRMWLEQQGVDPQHDVNIQVVPPQRMWQALAAGELDGFCAGEPWNSVAQEQGGSRLVVPAYDIWPDAPEKSLAVNACWSEHQPAAMLALTRVMYLACEWLDANLQAPELTQWLAGPNILDLPEETVSPALLSPLVRKKYFQQRATEPSEDRARSIALHIKRWHPGWVERDVTDSVLAFRPDIYRQVVLS